MSLRERLIREPAPSGAALFGRDEAAGPGGGNVYQEMKARLHRAIINGMDLTGLGPLEPLLADPEVCDILVNSPKQVYIERRGKLELTNVEFKDDEHLMRVIERIVSTVGRTR
jgi:pilus assembly protein CpaF